MNETKFNRPQVERAENAFEISLLETLEKDIEVRSEIMTYIKKTLEQITGLNAVMQEIKDVYNGDARTNDVRKELFEKHNVNHNLTADHLYYLTQFLQKEVVSRDFYEQFQPTSKGVEFKKEHDPSALELLKVLQLITAIADEKEDAA